MYCCKPRPGWNQDDRHFIASQLGSLDLEPGLIFPDDGAMGLVEDQFRARGVGNGIQQNMEPSQNPIEVSL